MSYSKEEVKEMFDMTARVLKAMGDVDTYTDKDFSEVKEALQWGIDARVEREEYHIAEVFSTIKKELFNKELVRHVLNDN